MPCKGLSDVGQSETFCRNSWLTASVSGGGFDTVSVGDLNVKSSGIYQGISP